MTSFPVRSNTAVLLVEPENPDNIGAAARAMKNTGLRDLRLVRPPAGWREKGKKMAVSAADLLETAKSYDAVRDALADRSLVIGTTRRGGPRRGFFLPFQKAMDAVFDRAQGGETAAVMFGKESKGLDNESLALCNWVTTLPAHPDFASFNLAQAVMIVAFKLFERTAAGADIAQFRATAAVPKRGRVRAAARKEKIRKIGEYSFLTQGPVDETLGIFKEALLALGYDKKGGQVFERIQVTLKGMIKRSGLLASEAQMIRGLSRRICERTQKR
jgi:TrmH family RNA methyltransferase